MSTVAHMLRTGAVVIGAALWLTSSADSGIAQPAAKPKPHASSPRPAAAKPAAAGENVPNAVQGFSTNRHEPIKIDADSLEVRDKDKVATFRGKVHVVQGDAELRCDVLTVFYEQPEDNGSGKPSPLPESLGDPAHPPAAGARPRHRDPKRSGRDRRQRRLRHAQESHHAARQRGGQPGPERAARRPAAGRHDDRGVAHRVSDHKGRVQGLFQPSKGDDKNAKPRDLSIMPKMQ